MSKSTIPTDLLLEQLADALEERETPDRRQQNAGLPEGISADRRRGDRRRRDKKADQPTVKT